MKFINYLVPSKWPTDNITDHQFFFLQSLFAIQGIFAIRYFCGRTFSVLELWLHPIHTIFSSPIIVWRKDFAPLKSDIALARLQSIKTELYLSAFVKVFYLK